MPAILMEVGFMSNPEELKRIESAHYREAIAESLTKALIEWRDEKSMSKDEKGVEQGEPDTTGKRRSLYFMMRLYPF